MKKIYALAVGATLLTLPSCIQEFEPQSSTVTSEQAGTAPGAYDNFVNGIPSSVCGQRTFPTYSNANDFGYPSLILMREVMGNDMVTIGGGYNWFQSWYTCSVSLAPIYLNCQYPWTYYYAQIKNCNSVLSLAGENPMEFQKSGAGIALAMRSLYYLELAQMYSQESYGQNPQSLTVPVVTDDMSISDAAGNPRVTYEKMMSMLLEDLDKAEEYLTGYERNSKEVPDVSVVNGLRARIYLLMEDWPNAEKYAKLAREDYKVMSADEYISKTNGFNDAYINESWMLCCSFKSDDEVMVDSRGNHSWGSWMICEVPSGKSDYGYYPAFGAGNYIDYHLYQSIPSTDARKNCYIDFALDKLSTETAQKLQLRKYTDVPDLVLQTSQNIGSNMGVKSMLGGMPLKFRAKNGNHSSTFDAYLVDVPMMRVEEMVLIEAEAAGRQEEARGITLLEAFAKTRDPQYVYGAHNEPYYNTSTPAFVNEVWWQRRVEFWGEGLATFDIKRLGKGIIRSYPNSNHLDGYRWNVQTTPQWMTFCIVQTETNNNPACVQNPTPIAPSGNSPEFNW